MKSVIFILTAGMTILNLLVIISLLGKQKLQLPEWGWLSPTGWWIFYPCYFYQIWFWSARLGLI